MVTTITKRRESSQDSGEMGESMIHVRISVTWRHGHKRMDTLITDMDLPESRSWLLF